MLTPDSIVPDPANPQSFNRYSYVENNPINFSDPTGHCKRPGECLVVGGQAGFSPNGEALQVAEAYMPGFTDKYTNAYYYEEFAKNVAGLIWEPVDWAVAASDGLQWYDGVGMLPMIPAAWGDNLGRFVSRYSDEVLQSVRIVDNPTFRKFTYGNLRENLSRFTGFMPTNEFEAHHILPRKFSEQFEAAGFVADNSIHNPLFGAWVQKSDHRGWTRAYQNEWVDFFDTYDNPTMEQILNHAKNLAEEYGFDVYFP